MLLDLTKEEEVLYLFSKGLLLTSEAKMKKSELAEKTKQELMEIARKAGLAGRSKMNKDDLVSSIAAILKEKIAESLKKAGSKQLVSTKRPAASKALTAQKAELPARQRGKKETIAVLPATAGKAETWQEKVEDTKFYLGAEERAFVTEEDLPAGYGDNRIVFMARDPHWAYVYWEINSQKIAEAKRKLRAAFDDSRLILRVYDITGIEFDGKNAHSFFDIEIPNLLGNWYVPLGRPNRTFCIDIGYMETGGGLFALSRSNKVTSPRDTFSEVLDEEWVGSNEEYKNIYAMSGGVGQAGSSAELAEMLKKRLEKEISSGGMRGLKPKESSHNH